LLDPNEKILLLYPTQSIKDFFKLLFLSLQENIFILHDMPSHNRFSKEIRLIMSIMLTTFRLKSKLVLMLDKQFEENLTTKISRLFTKSIVIFDKTERVHISQYILDKLSEVSIIPKISAKYTTKLESEYFDMSDFSEKYIVINPFASSENKSMSVEWYVEFLNKLSLISNKKIVLVGGKKDFEKSEEIKKNTKNVINVCGKTTFKQVLYILKNSYAMINVDSGPTHYGAIYEKPQIILWGENRNFSYMPVHNPNAIFIFGEKVVRSKDVYNNLKDSDFKKYPEIESVLLACKDLNF
jgi:ADP-heptose:LPS heptosyltransferase